MKYKHSYDIAITQDNNQIYSIMNRTIKHFTVAAIALMTSLVSCTKDDNKASDEQNLIENGRPSYNGHDYMDMGLPSGTKWATCNIGANKPEQYGNYYSWGETEPKKSYSWRNYLNVLDASFKDQNTCGTERDPLKEFVYPNFKTLAGTVYDVAHVKWGGSWVMPSDAQFHELFNEDHCTLGWVTQNGVNGFKVTSLVNGNSLFFPAAGDMFDDELTDEGSFGSYWSATSTENSTFRANTQTFHNNDDRDGHYSRYIGMTVRAVSK